MSVSQKSDVLEKVEQLAVESGIQGEYDAENLQYVIRFGLEEGRTQDVYVGDSSLDSEVRVITVHSPCLVVEKGIFKGLSKKMAVELLLLNEELNFARYGIEQDEESYVILVSCDLLLDGLEAKGFEAALECVALAADSYEARFGQDVY